MKYARIPKGKDDGKRRFYYKCYEDNSYCPSGTAGAADYSKGSGAEIQPTEKVANGKLVKSPAKIANIVSSSAMLFNLMDDDPVAVTSLIECI